MPHIKKIIPEISSNNTEPDVSAEKQSVCAGCPEADKCRRVWSMPNEGPFTSGGLLLGSIAVFLLPIVLAIAGGAAVRAAAFGGTGREIAGAAAGLLAGAFLAWRLMPFLKKRFSRR